MPSGDSGPLLARLQAGLSKHPDHAIAGLLIAPLAVLLLVLATLSLEWRMVHDTPILHYLAFQIDRFGSVPYRDTFETSMPGSLLIHLAIGKLFGYGDFAFRCVDLALLALVLTATASILSNISRRVALAATVLFGLAYLGAGTAGVMQRDYLGLIAIICALWLVARGRFSPRVRAFTVGVLVGLAVCVKPHLGIGFPFLFGYMSVETWEASGRKREWTAPTLRLLIPAVLGILVPIMVCFAWLAWNGGLSHFWVMLSSYMPLYLRLDGQHVTMQGWDRATNMLRGLRNLGGLQLWLAPAFVGTYVPALRGNSLQETEAARLVGARPDGRLRALSGPGGAVLALSLDAF